MSQKLPSSADSPPLLPCLLKPPSNGFVSSDIALSSEMCTSFVDFAGLQYKVALSSTPQLATWQKV